MVSHVLFRKCRDTIIRSAVAACDPIMMKIAFEYERVLK